MSNKRTPTVTNDPADGGAMEGRDTGGHERRLHKRAGLAWLAVVVVAIVVTLTITLLPGASRPPPRAVVAALPFWNITNGSDTVLAHKSDFTEVSPWMYGLSPSGQINTQYNPGSTAAVNAELTRLRAAGMKIIPTLANVTNGQFTYQPLAGILHDPARMKQHVAAIVNLVVQQRYAGIDIDYENLQAGDRQAFTTFITDLAHALHAHGKMLSVAVFAKTSNAGVDPRNAAQNFAAIGRVADQVRLMAYDYHWATSPPGPIAPLPWVRSVLKYAKSQIPAHKIILGIPLYGYDWSGGKAQTLSWLSAFRLSRAEHAAAHYNKTAQSPWFSYTDASGHRHVVWFENQASSQAKFSAALGAQIGGVYLWMFGYEDTGTWSALSHTLPVPASSRSGLWCHGGPWPCWSWALTSRCGARSGYAACPSS
jgi:spore germination protein